MVRVVKQDGKVLTVEVDIEPSFFEPSTSGKTLVSGTGGFLAIAGGMKISLNVTKPNPNYKAPEVK